jgi:hypothetical protein
VALSVSLKFGCWWCWYWFVVREKNYCFTENTTEVVLKNITIIIPARANNMVSCQGRWARAVLGGARRPATWWPAVEKRGAPAVVLAQRATVEAVSGHCYGSWPSLAPWKRLTRVFPASQPNRTEWACANLAKRSYREPNRPSLHYASLARG